MKEILEHIRNRLEQCVDSSETETVTRALCLELLGISQSDFYLKSKVVLPADRKTLLDSALERLAAGEPLQYVLGNTPFAGLEFHVDRRVLIPRPETAELVAWILDDHHSETGSLLDVGTGSGCIAVSFSVNRPGWSVCACDVSDGALEVAQGNCDLNHSNVRFFNLDILSPAECLSGLDVIVSNPPYITVSEKDGMEKTVLDFEPELALFVPDNDPLLFYRAVAAYGQKALRAGGTIYFEINPLFAHELCEMLGRLGYSDVEIRRDIFGKERMIKAIYHE